MRGLDELKQKTLQGADPIMNIAAEPRASDRCLGALRDGHLYVLGLKSGGDEAAYNKLIHRDGADVVWPLFSSWATAKTFIRACGIEDTEQFIIVPADQFLAGYDCATMRAFINPRTAHERELWPEEARAVQDAIQLRAADQRGARAILEA